MGEAKKILVVDDNRTIRKALENSLSEEGFKDFTAGDGKEGLAVATREVPDLIVSDVDMPVMDGGEMVSRLKASSVTSPIPVIFLSGLVTRKGGVQKSSSANLYISKTCGPAELLSAIRSRLGLPVRDSSTR